MEQVSRLSFVPLIGEPPPGVDLDPLPPPEAVRSDVAATFSDFFSVSADVETVDGKSRPKAPAFGIHVIYAYGHAWATPEGPYSASEGDGKTVIESGKDLLSRLLSAESAERTLLILDTCYAAAFESCFVPPV